MRTVTEALKMHANDVETEIVRIRAFTEDRFLEKADRYEQSLTELQKHAKVEIGKVRMEGAEIENVLKYRLDDFKI